MTKRKTRELTYLRVNPGLLRFDLLELLVMLVDIGGLSASKAGLDTQSSGAARTNIRRLMVDLNMPFEGSVDESNSNVNAPPEGAEEKDFESHEMSIVRDPAMHSYHPDSDGEEIEVEPVNVDVVDEEETSYFTHGQPALTQPAVTEKYDHPTHFTTLNLGAMRLDNSYHQRGPDDDPTSEFEVWQQFDNKESVFIAIKTYNFRRAVEYKIPECCPL
ncbi:hypothetical protein PIB30_032544 [Stylosanthes scabra]|uniref:Uncharacterized protein n=1 Tax=Stylosanthes scabra TaxID=79078 RepID=A0ABU6Z9U7_9FABA|nr:hypothetical protein [Stylosanthes scabra]